jgi:hypothetical protein
MGVFFSKTSIVEQAVKQKMTAVNNKINNLFE